VYQAVRETRTPGEIQPFLRTAVRSRSSLAASSGIGYELAKQCAGNGFDLLVAADEPAIHDAASDFRALGTGVEAVEADLASIEGVEKLYAATRGRRIEALLANAGRGLGKSFLDQNFMPDVS
jgi:uncharacterized protein